MAFEPDELDDDGLYVLMELVVEFGYHMGLLLFRHYGYKQWKWHPELSYQENCDSIDTWFHEVDERIERLKIRLDAELDR
jgi:hypothetical protein